MSKWRDLPRLEEKVCSHRLNAIGDALYVVGGKWKLKVIVALMSGPLRFNEIQRTVKGISAKVLASELKELEMNGFARRNVYTGNPVVVEYELTDYSFTLRPVLDALSEWGAMHKSRLMHGTGIADQADMRVENEGSR